MDNETKNDNPSKTGLAIGTGKHVGLIQVLKEADEFAEWVKNSDYGKAFEKNIVDPNDPDKTIKDISKADIIANILIGKEIGISAIQAVMLGKKLNSNSTLAVQKGKQLGLSTVDSIESIYLIPGQNGVQTYTGVHVISSVLLRNGVKYTIIKEYDTHWEYINAKSKIRYDDSEICDVEGNLKSGYYLCIVGITTEADLLAAKAEGKIIVLRNNIGKITIIKFERLLADKTIKVHYERFTSEMGREEGFLPKWDEKGILISEGKKNWLARPHSMFRSRCISRGGRFMAADLLHGTLSTDEAVDTFGIEDAEIVE